MKKLIDKEKELGCRWSKCIEHHPESEKLMKFIMLNDFENYNDHFCWKIGGDGDNGETLMYQMDAYFEAKDKGEI
jgi:hypothetical protein